MGEGGAFITMASRGETGKTPGAWTPMGPKYSSRASTEWLAVDDDAAPRRHGGTAASAQRAQGRCSEPRGVWDLGSHDAAYYYIVGGRTCNSTTIVKQCSLDGTQRLPT